MECNDNLNSFVNTGRPGRSGADVVEGVGGTAEKMGVESGQTAV